jgi:hypothetical protein
MRSGALDSLVRDSPSLAPADLAFVGKTADLYIRHIHIDNGLWNGTTCAKRQRYP